MTPLAQAIVNDRLRLVKDRTFKDQSGLLPRLIEAHCFEVSDVFDAASGLAEDLQKRGMTLRGTRTFLPASLTWIEWAHRSEDGSITGRQGLLLDAADGAEFATSTWAFKGGDLFLSAQKQGALSLTGDGKLDQEYLSVREFENDDWEEKAGWVAHIYALLSLINTPRIIGRRQHMPHAGLQRKLAASKGMPGKHPLAAWTEIILEVTTPREARENGEHEAHLTGGKALHFVRAHLRVDYRTLGSGQLEYFKVREHWRGNGFLGIKRSRYTVKRPKPGHHIEGP